jgi:hypothetical protein
MRPGCAKHRLDVEKKSARLHLSHAAGLFPLIIAAPIGESGDA